MISTIDIKNFGKIKEAHIECRGKNVFLIAENGKGKTTVLQAISLALTGKLAKNLTIDKMIGPHGNDFLITLELDDGTKIGRTSKKSKLRFPDGRVYNKTKDVYENLTFDPQLLFNLSYVKQGEMADLFMGGGKQVVDKLVSMVINNKRLSEGYTIINRQLSQNEATIEALKARVENDSSKYNLEELSSLKKRIAQDKKKLDQIESTQSLEEIENNRRIHDIYNQSNLRIVDAQKAYEEHCQQQMEDVDVEAARKLYQKYKAVTQYSNDLENQQERLNKLKYIESFGNKIKEFLDIDLRLIRNSYSIEALNAIGKKNQNFKNVLTTTNHFNSQEEAIDELEEFWNNRNIDTDTIVKAKESFERVRTLLKPIECEVKEMKQNGYTSSNFDSRIASNKKSIETEMDRLKKCIEESTDTPMTEEQYFEIVNKHTQYTLFMEERQKLKDRIDHLTRSINEIRQKIKEIPSMEELDNAKASYLARETVKNAILSMERQVAMLNSIHDEIEASTTRIRDLSEESKRLEYWKSILSEAPNRLRQGLFTPVVAYLNKQFYELFSFTGLGDIDVDWNKVQITVGGKTFEQCSGAQMVALGLCMRLALLQVMGSYVPIMLIDEPTMFLDDDRKNDVKKLLSYMSKYSQIIACTHDDEIVGNNALIINVSNFN